MLFIAAPGRIAHQFELSAPGGQKITPIFARLGAAVERRLAEDGYSMAFEVFDRVKNIIDVKTQMMAGIV